MASASYKSSVIGAVMAGCFGTAVSMTEAHAETQTVALLPPQTDHCTGVEFVPPPIVSLDEMRLNLAAIVRTLENLALNDLIYIEDYLHEMPVDDPASIKTMRAVEEYFNQVYAFTTTVDSHKSSDMLHALSKSLLGYVDVIEDMFSGEPILHEEFAKIQTNRLFIAHALSGTTVATSSSSCDQPNMMNQLAKDQNPVLAF